MWRELYAKERQAGQSMIEGFKKAMDRADLNITVEEVFVEAFVSSFDDSAPVDCYRLSVHVAVAVAGSGRVRGYHSPNITPMQFMRWPNTLGGLIADWLIHDLKSGVKDENKNE